MKIYENEKIKLNSWISRPNLGDSENTNGTAHASRSFWADIWVLDMATDVNTPMMQQNGSCHRSIFMPTEHTN